MGSTMLFFSRQCATLGAVLCRNSFITAISVITLAFSNLALAMEARVVLNAKSVEFKAQSADVGFLSVTVVSPSGEIVLQQQSDNSVTWSVPENTTDGSYKYEVKLSTVKPGSAKRQGKAMVGAQTRSQSGAVLISDGAVVLPIEEGEAAVSRYMQQGVIAVLDFLIPTAQADQVFVDDVIVQNSICTGIDCNNGENFGFDTLRLRENNLRIHFDDTSSSASFPSSDWRIVINDTSNGGRNYFGIEHANSNQLPLFIEAGAANNALFLGANGRVGLGTSLPGATLDILSGNSPTLRFSQDGSLGFAAQSWDLGGNENGFFINDVNNSLASPFQIRSGAPSNSLFVAGSGNLGVGTAAPSEKLHVVGNAIISGNLELGSSRTIKHAIESLDLSEALKALSNLQPVSYRYNHTPEEQTLGFIAEDVPDLVATQSRKSLKPMDIVAVLTKVVKAQQQTIDELSSKVDQLTKQQTSN